MQGKFDEALEAFTQALRSSPNKAPIYFNMGLIYLEQGNFQKGEEMLLEAIRFNPDHQTARLTLGTLYEDRGKLEEALRAYELARNIQPESPTGRDAAANAQVVKGRLFENEDKLDDALSAYQAATEIQPKNPLTFFRAGLVHLRKSQRMTGEEARSQLAAAEKAFEQVIALNPRAQDAHIALADIYEKTDRDEKALETYEKTISIGPSPLATFAGARLHLLKGVRFAQEERYDEARAEFEETLRIKPDEKSALINLGMIHLQNKEGFAALEELKKAAGIDPADRNLQFRLASLYGELGESAEALRLYQSILEAEQETSFGGELKERINSLYKTLSLGYEVIYDSNVNSSEQGQSEFMSLLSGQYQWSFDSGSRWRTGIRLNPEMFILHKSQVAFFNGKGGLFMERRGYLRRITLSYNLQVNLFEGSLSSRSHELSWEGSAASGRTSLIYGTARFRYVDFTSDERFSGLQPAVSAGLIEDRVWGGRFTSSGLIFGNWNTKEIGREFANIGFSPSISYDKPLFPGVIGNLYYAYNVSRYLNLEPGFNKRRLNRGHSAGGGVVLNLERGIQVTVRGSWSDNRSNLAGVASTLEQALAGNNSLGNYEKWTGNVGLRLIF
jgi:tetratricopeptide (TPR) repeat protein